MIKASLAGICYPAERSALLKTMRGWFDQPESAVWETGSDSHPLAGVIAPHIDFRVNTAVYAKAFAPWLSSPPADKILILGVGHRAKQEWSLDGRSYVTPIGEVRTDTAGLELLARRLPKELWDDPTAHVREHSIEFPLVLLQTLRALRGIERPFEFIPVLCGGLFRYIETGTIPDDRSMLHRLGTALREWWQACEAQGQRVEMIVSIDGCHMGPRFGHDYAVDEKILAHCAAWESALWEEAGKGDLPGFLTYLQHDGNQRYFDGVGALGLTMSMWGDRARGMIQRTGYAQWFEPEDTSAVTFSSGTCRG